MWFRRFIQRIVWEYIITRAVIVLCSADSLTNNIALTKHYGHTKA